MMNPAETLNQLTNSENGANRLITMTGAKNLVHSKEENFLSFKLPKGVYVKIKLNVMDTYDMTFGKMRKFEYKETASFKGLYSEMLKKTFETHTGLYLTF